MSTRESWHIKTENQRVVNSEMCDNYRQSTDVKLEADPLNKLKGIISKNHLKQALKIEQINRQFYRNQNSFERDIM